MRDVSTSLSHLCCLINDSLHPFTEEEEVINLTKEKEKHLLVALSQVFKEIQILKRRLLSQDSDEEDKCDKKSCGGELELYHDDHNCLIKTLAHLISFITIESHFVQHLVGSILLIVSEFVAASGIDWDCFISSLFICLKLAIGNVLSHSFVASTNGAGDSKCDLYSVGVLKSILVYANWSTASAITRVLRSILKYLKQEDDDQLLKAYSHSVSSFLLDVPADFMCEIQAGQCGETKECDSQNNQFTDALFVRSVDEKQEKVVFLGTFIQILCSLAEQSCAAEAKVGSQDNCSVLCSIISFVPKLLSCCLGEQGPCVNMSVSPYFRHKLLMLMLRLSYQPCVGYFMLASWLQLLHNYFEVLLWKPIIKFEFAQDESLEGSPFLLSLSNREEHGIISHHLQRWVILLFLRCCFGLINLTGDMSEQCTCGTINHCSSYSSSELDCCGRKKGFLELHKWLEGHLSIDKSLGREIYFEKCTGFTLSFLQLYMHEDDVLFKVLLQLLSMHSCLEQQSNGEKWKSEDVKEDTCSYISHVFNPVYLFHLFLAELHYDHVVLLDYLISKDTGISCAEYLLRCLRVICDSWHLFVTFSMHDEVINYSSCKKRKMFLDASDDQVDVSHVHVESIPSSLEEKGKEDFKFSQKHCKTRRKLFKEAKNCLLSLKDSVENLQRKNLFPYNPKVLLKRLTKFEELCLDRKNNSAIFDLSS